MENNTTETALACAKRIRKGVPWLLICGLVTAVALSCGLVFEFDADIGHFAFGAASFIREGANIWLVNALFALAGVGWATINVNSYPMVVELSRDSDIGRYTGFYYTATMAAQTITPILSGIFMDIRFTLLFPYATLFVALAFFTMLPVRHGDNKPKGKETPSAS